MTEQFKTELRNLSSKMAEGDNDDRGCAVAIFAALGSVYFGNIRELSDMCATFSKHAIAQIERERAALKVQGN